MVMHNLNKPNSEAKQQLGNISRKIAQCVTDLAAAAELLKDDDWVDPSDPTFIAENELLGAAKSIDAAAKKLAALKPRGEIKGKVRGLLFSLFCLDNLIYTIAYEKLLIYVSHFITIKCSITNYANLQHIYLYRCVLLFELCY